MFKYRKKPVVIEAFQLDFGDDTHPLQKYPGWFNDAVTGGLVSYQGGAVPGYIIATLEGDMKAIQGDWIIKGVKGELYPCKPEVFALTYEAVE